MSDEPKYRIKETGPANSRRFHVEFKYDNQGDWMEGMFSPSFDSFDEARKWLDDKTTVRPPDIIHAYP